MVRAPLLGQTPDGDHGDGTPELSQPMYAGRWVARSTRAIPADLLRHATNHRMFESEPYDRYKSEAPARAIQQRPFTGIPSCRRPKPVASIRMVYEPDRIR